MQKRFWGVGVGLAMMTSLGFAGSAAVPNSVFFAGVGGSYNPTQALQTLYGYIGETNVYDNGGTLVANGIVGGPTSPLTLRQKSFAPLIQGGILII